MSRKLRAKAGVTGDIIFVLGSNKRERLNLRGQSLLRLFRIFRGGFHPARYSHVMLVLSPGLVIHADGKSVKVQPLADIVLEETDRSRFRATRFVGDQLKDRSNGRAHDRGRQALAEEALKFYNQKYSFIYGRRPGWMGSFLHRSSTKSFPFCSELISAAYGAAGHKICNLPYDRTLPLDLEAQCVPPLWKDVTDEFDMEIPSSSPLDRETISLEDEELTLSQFLAAADRLLKSTNRADADFVDVTYQFVISQIRACVLFQQIRSFELQMAKLGAVVPESLLGNVDAVRRDLASLPSFNETLNQGLGLPSSSTAESIRALFPNLRPDAPVYEGFPSIQDLQHFELLGASISFGALALRLETVLTAIAVPLGFPLKNVDRFSKITRGMVEPFLDAIPPFAQDQLDPLRSKIPNFTMPTSDEFQQQIRGIFMNVCSLHALLSLLLHRHDQRSCE
jgi:hypothetical protein